MDKHYVYSARTTEQGLALLNKTKGDMSWDAFLNNAVATHYGLDIGVIALPPSRFLAERQAAKEQRAKEKAERAAKKEAERTARAEAKKVADKAKAEAAKVQKASEKASHKGKAVTGSTPKVEKLKASKVAAVKGAGARGTKKPALVS
ncbi:MAG: hypothetical protein WC370_01860 [Dehalococcoidales bacterium]|jgi:FKBP-type peptidyl-prolyl cis-trans isomerase